MTRTSDYQNQKVALLTMHGKEKIIAPILEPHLGCVVEHVTGFDTESPRVSWRPVGLSQTGIAV